MSPRLTSESATVYATFDAHTELLLMPSAAPMAEGDAVHSGGGAEASAAVSRSSACGGGGARDGLRTRPKEALAALAKVHAIKPAAAPAGAAAAGGGGGAGAAAAAPPPKAPNVPMQRAPFVQ